MLEFAALREGYNEYEFEDLLRGTERFESLLPHSWITLLPSNTGQFPFFQAIRVSLARLHSGVKTLHQPLLHCQRYAVLITRAARNALTGMSLIPTPYITRIERD